MFMQYIRIIQSLRCLRDKKIINAGSSIKSRLPTLKKTGDERIELPPKVLETPIIPFDQSPKFVSVAIIHTKGTLVKNKCKFCLKKLLAAGG